MLIMFYILYVANVFTPLYIQTLRSRSSEKVSTMMPKMMLRPIVVMKMKNETWKMTRNPNLMNELSAGWLTRCYIQQHTAKNLSLS